MVSSIIIEPFNSGSHKQLIDLLSACIPDCSVFSLPGKKWHWRARTSALHFSQTIPIQQTLKTLFCSSVLNLAELVALRADLSNAHKILYFHENQLVYPRQLNQKRSLLTKPHSMQQQQQQPQQQQQSQQHQKQQQQEQQEQGEQENRESERDFQYGYNQILSCLVADEILFNSSFNMESFLSSFVHFFNTMPDYRPHGLEEKIRPKCRVLYFPLVFSSSAHCTEGTSSLQEQNSSPLVIQKDRSHNKAMLLANENCKSLECKDSVKLMETSGEKFCGDIEHNVVPNSLSHQNLDTSAEVLHIVWPHRWEHDKNPEEFFSVLCRLHEENLSFSISVIGQTYTEVPECFEKAKVVLKDHIRHWGYIPDKDSYLELLRTGGVVVSTAIHEFYGVAMLEATHCGCFPLCPNRLSYPEIFPSECLYNTSAQLYKRLKAYCVKPWLASHHRKTANINLSRFSWEHLKESYQDLFKVRQVK